MLANMKIIVVLPAYNAAETLKQTYDEIPHDVVDEIILIDDASKDATVEMAQSLGIPTIRHNRNRGYGGNQKTCYTIALARGADIVVMLRNSTMREQLEASGVVVATSRPDQLASKNSADAAMWKSLIEADHITVE